MPDLRRIVSETVPYSHYHIGVPASLRYNGLVMETIPLTPQMLVVLGILALTVILFVTEVVRLDVAALSVLVLLGLLTLLPGLEDLVDARELFVGFSSNAVISIIAVMILGAGLNRTGVMSRLAAWIMRIGGRTERSIIPLISGTAGLFSGFMQNIGAAALFLPVVSSISARTGLVMSRLLIPMGFCVMMGGTLTLVGSSPLILLNDLLPRGMEPFQLFDVTPIGLALIATGILYFVFGGQRVLPVVKGDGASAESLMDYYREVYGLQYAVREVKLKAQAAWTSQTVDDVEKAHGIVVVGTFMNGEIRVGPWRGLTIESKATLAVMGSQQQLDELANDEDLVVSHELYVFGDALSRAKAGMAEVVIPPNSNLIGRSVAEVAMRKTYGLSVLAIHRGEKTIRNDLRDMPLRSGDTLACHCAWNALARLERNPDFVVVTSEYPREELRPQKVHLALGFFALTMGLILFTDLRLSLALMAGALGMILSGVLSVDEAYTAISWRTVFLLACLIPLGMAVEDTGTANWIATNTLAQLGEAPAWVLQACIAILATAFSLILSHVGATVLLVPLAVNLALAAQGLGIEADPRVFALTVAIATSNAFLIPTNPVNALIMGPGGYRVKDFIKAGAGMTVLFLIVSLVMLNLLF